MIIRAWFLFLLLSCCAISAQAAITLRSAASNGASSGSLTITKPTGTVTGDVMVVTVAVRPVGATIATPSGWTLANPPGTSLQNNDVTMRMVTYYRVATAGEPASYTWTFGTTHTGAVGGIGSFSGVDTGNPVDVATNNVMGYTSFAIQANGVTTTVANTVLVTSHAFTSAAQGWSPPGGMTEMVDVASEAKPAVTGMGMEMNYEARPTAGATGARSATADSTGTDQGFGIGHSVALRPAAKTMTITTPSAVNEGNSGTSTLAFTVSLSAMATATTTATYAFADVTATGGSSCTTGIDYINTGGTVTINSGSATGTINVTLCGDTIYEANETFTVTLASPVNATLGSPSSATGTISNDDSLAPRAEYRFDECTLTTAVAGSVKDTSGNNRHATPYAPVSPSPVGKINRAYDLSADTTTDYLKMDYSALSGLTDFTVSLWFKTSVSKSQQEILHGLRLSSTSADELEIYLVNSTQVVVNVRDSPDLLYTVSTPASLTDGNWHHLAFTRSGNTGCLYIDSNLAGACKTTYNSAALSLDPNGFLAGQEQDSIGGGFTQAQGSRAVLDELKFFDGALSAMVITAGYTNESAGNNWDGTTRSDPCATCALGSFRITQNTTALACPDTRAAVTVEPMCADGATVKTDYVGTVNLSTTPAAGSFFNAASGGSAISALSFVGDLSKTAYLYYPKEGSLCAIANDGGVTTTAGSCTSYHAYGFRVGSQPADHACGNTRTLTLTAYGKNESGSGCSTITNFSGNKNLKAWFTSGVDTDNPATVQASNRALSITGSATGISNKTEPATANLSNINFSSGTATLTVGYPNAAKIFGLNFKHDAAPYNGGACAATAPFCPLTAQTNAFVVYPNSFGLAVTDSGSACVAGDTSCAAFRAAGATFNMRLQALCADGTTVASDYRNGSAAIPLGVSVFAPATASGGVNGSVGTTSTNISSAGYIDFSQTWSEVGVANFTASPPTWFGRTLAAATTANVGRFYPDHFDTAVTAAGGVPMTCPAGLTCPALYNGMVYAGQPVTVTVTAKNQSGGLTANYSNATPAFSKAVTLNAFAGLGSATTLSGTSAGSLAGNTIAAAGFNAGSATASPKYTFATPPGTPTDIYLRATEDSGGDGVSSLRATNPTTTSVEGGVKVAQGRISLSNVFGNGRSALQMPIRALFWSGNSWVPSATDTSSLTQSAVALSPTTNISGFSWTNGTGFITLDPPASSGHIDVALNLGATSAALASCVVSSGGTAANMSWLRSPNGCAATYDRDPSARATFGIYAPETRKSIHVRELY